MKPGAAFGDLKPEKNWTVRKYRDKQQMALKRQRFWHNRFEQAGILGVGPRSFYEDYGKAFLKGEKWAIELWNRQENSLLETVHEVLAKEITNDNLKVCIYEPAAGPGEVTVQEMPAILKAGGEWFASDFDRLPVTMNKERVRSLQPVGQDWLWRIARANVAYFKKWIDQFQPPTLNKNLRRGVVVSRICKHLDDVVLEEFLKQVGQTMDFVLLAEAVRDGFEKEGIRIGIDRKEKPGTQYRYLEQHTSLLGMKVKFSRECINFGDPYFIGILTH